MIELLLLVTMVVVLWAGAFCAARVRRLDRLHRRMDAARAGLESALRRRAAAAEGAGVLAVPLMHGLDRDREAAENALGRALASVDRALLPAAVLDELVETEQLVAIARRVHNDAVRDTLVLRSRLTVRWLRLAGSAPMPEYFEIADPVSAVEAATKG